MQVVLKTKPFEFSEAGLSDLDIASLRAERKTGIGRAIGSHGESRTRVLQESICAGNGVPFRWAQPPKSWRDRTRSSVTHGA